MTAQLFSEQMQSHVLRDYQIEAVDAVEKELEDNRGTMIVLPTGCHAKGQRVILSNGETVPVESIQVGDSLMGPDSLPRIVTNLCRGTDDSVNRELILTIN